RSPPCRTRGSVPFRRENLSVRGNDRELAGKRGPAPGQTPRQAELFPDHGTPRMAVPAARKWASDRPAAAYKGRRKPSWGAGAAMARDRRMDSEDLDLMTRVATGDEQAVAQLYDRFGSLVYRMAYQTM